MEKYSKEEIENFRKKDKRISLQGLVQVILATGANVHEVKENCDLAKQYSDCIEELVESGFEKPKEKNNGLELLKAEDTIGKMSVKVAAPEPPFPTISGSTIPIVIVPSPSSVIFISLVVPVTQLFKSVEVNTLLALVESNLDAVNPVKVSPANVGVDVGPSLVEPSLAMA